MALSDYDFKKIFLVLAGLFIFLLAIVGSFSSVFFYNKYQTAEKRLKEAATLSQEEVRTLVAKVGKLIKLPEGELPTVATITDLAKLNDQPFFAKAKVGDKVLLFTQAKKAILYDPVGNVVVEVGPLILPTGTSPTPASDQTESLTYDQDIQGIQTTNPTPSSLTPTPAALKVAVYNGTDVASTMDNFVSDLQINYPKIKIVQKSNAAKHTYSKTLLVDLAGNKKEAATDLAENIQAEISTLPYDEQTPTNADILIILGQDRLKTE